MSFENILAYLLNPNKYNFRLFYNECYLITKGYLYNRRKRGYPIPLTDSDLDRTLDNLTVSILSEFLVPSGNQSCYMIFDYFKRHGIEIEENSDPKYIEKYFRILLYGFIKRHLPKIIGIEDPQQKQLKKTIRIILAKDSFGKKDKHDKKYVFLKMYKEELFEYLLSVEIELMCIVLNEVYFDSNTYVEICKNFFLRLYEYEEHQNLAEYHPLVKAIIELYKTRIDLDYSQHGYIMSPENQLIRTNAECARGKSVEFVRTNCIDEFVDKRRLSEKETKPVINALKLLIDDYSYDGTHDLLPKYFKESMPIESYKKYHQDYRYVFETLVNKMKDKFRELMKNDS